MAVLRLDLAVAVENFPIEENGLAIVIGNGDGSFQPPTISVAGEATDVTAGDFNADGKADLALAGKFADVVRVLLGNGDGTFQSAIEYSTHGTAETVVPGRPEPGRHNRSRSGRCSCCGVVRQW